MGEIFLMKTHSSDFRLAFVNSIFQAVFSKCIFLLYLLPAHIIVHASRVSVVLTVAMVLYAMILTPISAKMVAYASK